MDLYAFEQKINGYIEQDGRTQAAVARRLGYHPDRFNKWVRGVNRMPYNVIYEFANLLKLDKDQEDELYLLAGYSRCPPIAKQEEVSRPHRREDWNEAFGVHHFFGRKEELAQLEQWIVKDHCRLVGVFGMGGIGKTVLAARLGETIKGQFQYVIWRSLLNAPPLEDVLTSCIQILSDHQKPVGTDNIDRKIVLLIDYFRQHRCLLVLDNVEAILREDCTGHYRAGYEEYGKLIRRVGELGHQSCLLLTSRERPKEFTGVVGKESAVQIFELAGLGQADVQQILNCVFGTEEAWVSLINRYSGNPKALQLVAAHIRDLFNGNIADFLEAEAPIFDNLRNLLKEQFDRLSELEQEIMYWLAIEREAISLDFLKENFITRSVSKQILLKDLDSLRRRSLVEQNGGSFTLQNVVMECMTHHFVEQICEEILSGQSSRLTSHALIKANARDYVRESQIRLILNPVAEKLLASESRAKLEDIFSNLLVSLRTQPSSSQGYAVGNILNLINQLDLDASHFNFSHLTIRQAYLRGVDLHGVDFSYANLSECVFTESFGRVNSVIFSPDNRILASTHNDYTIRLWDISFGKCIRKIQTDIHQPRSVAFSPDGQILASGCDDGSVLLWNINDWWCLQILQGHKGMVEAVAFSPDGLVLASGSHDSATRLWDVNDWGCLQILPGHNGMVESIAFSPDGQVLATGCQDGSVLLWDIDDGECLRISKEHDSMVEAVAFSPNGELLASGSHDGTIRIWNVRDWVVTPGIQGHMGWITSIAFSGDDTLVSGGYDGTVRIWDINTRRCLNILTRHTYSISTIACSSNGQTLASGGFDQMICLWDIKTMECIKTFFGHSNWVNTAVFSPNGQLCASGGHDRTVRIWDVNNEKCLLALQGHTGWVNTVIFSPDGRLLASGSHDRTIRLWNVRLGQCVGIFTGHSGLVRAISFSPDGKILASAGFESQVRLWDIDSEQCFQTVETGTSPVRSVAFSPDGQTLAFVGDNETVCLWNIRNKKCFSRLKGHTGWINTICFSPDGKLLASGGYDRTIRLWNVGTGECLGILQNHTGWVRSIAFSHDGRVLASGSYDWTICLWNVNASQLLCALEGHTAMVNSVSFDHTSRHIISSSTDGTIKLWEWAECRCINTLFPDPPYYQMNISGVTGLSNAQKADLKALGVVDFLDS